MKDYLIIGTNNKWRITLLEEQTTNEGLPYYRNKQQMKDCLIIGETTNEGLPYYRNTQQMKDYLIIGTNSKWRITLL